MKLLATRRLVLGMAALAAASLSAVSLSVVPAIAADSPAQLIQSVADEVIQIIKSAKGPDREAAIQKILTTNFDTTAISRPPPAPRPMPTASASDSMPARP